MGRWTEKEGLVAVAAWGKEMSHECKVPRERWVWPALALCPDGWLPLGLPHSLNRGSQAAL